MKSPKRHKDYSERILVPPRPFEAAWQTIPEVVRVSMTPLSGIQPLTAEMFESAGQELRTKPTEEEIKLFREKGTKFQMISLVLTMAFWEEVDDRILGVPCSLHVLPSIKRGKVQYCEIDTVASLADLGERTEFEDVYAGFDPFSGKYSMSVMGGDYVAWSRQKRPLTDVGFVLERYFLASEFDKEDVAEFDSFIPDAHKKAYKRNRIKKLYTPFKRWESRHIWGVESDIERFLFQELLSRGLRPQLQWIIYRSGQFYQSLYDVYKDVEFRHGAEMLTEADLFFPDEKVAVFCDGAKHHRRKKDREKDERINAALINFGITPIRVSGQEIRSNLEAVGDRIQSAVS
jgi:hypothetical protein